MKKRILFGLIMIAATTALLGWDHHLQVAGAPLVGAPMAGLTALLVIVGYLEFARLAAGAGLPVMRATGVIAALAVTLTPLLRQCGCRPAAVGDHLLLITLALATMAAFFVQIARYRTQTAIRRLAGTLTGVLYLGVLSACLLAIRIRFGMPALVLFLAAVKLTDIGAYFTGSFFGRHKMIPWLSPGKSWEGLGGGLVTAAAAAAILNYAFGVGLQPMHAAALGAVLGVVGQFGDLCESLLKRDAGLKDSGALVPEYGGVLDMIDSPLVAAPVGYLLLAVLLP